MAQTTLPVHGFVLAGGQSTRMGEDKALLRFCGKPMVEIAVATLRSFCAEVGIAANRDDLGGYAEVLHEPRSGVGPAAGVEAGLLAARHSWAMFMPVDVPLMPPEVLRAWARSIVRGEDSGGVCASYLTLEDQPQPAFCLLRRECIAGWSAALEGGERRLLRLLRGLRVMGFEAAHEVDIEELAGVLGRGRSEARAWCSNVNTPEEFARAEAAYAGNSGEHAS
ncbi:MAG: molybdenum cofactor guanylyltransferase [Acidobacteria bacterium]|nr:molybdenum cofactor guanylyltransferase [Acidobacteriota bacterium]